MESQEIIRSISSVYERFNIPPWLQMHMMRVAAVANLVCDNFAEGAVNTQDVVAALLIHDLGNMIKSNLDGSLTIMGEEAMRLDYWKSVRADMIARYGNEEHTATSKMAEEIGVSPRVMQLIDNTGVPRIQTVSQTGDLEQKICSYSDMRVGPFGILSVQRRFADLKARYSYRPHKTLTDEGFQKVLDTMLEMEKLILSNTPLTPSQINDGTIEPYVLKYKQKLRSTQ